jgi:hypothetical protein
MIADANGAVVFMPTIAESLLPEFDHEMANTRRTLARVPDDRPDFRPHDKSTTLARLAGHLTDIPWWTVAILTRDRYDMLPDGAPARAAYVMTTRDALLQRFDAEVDAARIGAAQLRAEPRHPPSRAARRLSPPERRACSVDLRPIGRRRRPVNGERRG